MKNIYSVVRQLFDSLRSCYATIFKVTFILHFVVSQTCGWKKIKTIFAKVVRVQRPFERCIAQHAVFYIQLEDNSLADFLTCPVYEANVLREFTNFTLRPQID